MDRNARTRRRSMSVHRHSLTLVCSLRPPQHHPLAQGTTHYTNTLSHTQTRARARAAAAIAMDKTMHGAQ
eukprot:scaffold9125_cov36-Tisochrysis_lutea.AAC.2